MNGPPIAAVSALIGDPARARMLTLLMDGRARTATELADWTGVTRQTASTHLAKLTGRGLLALERQGRHRYFRLATPEVASVLESLMVLEHRTAADKPTHHAPEQRARTCYDHLAGHLGVALLDSLNRHGHLEYRDSELALSHSGRELAGALGLELTAPQPRRRPLARMCLDWSERRHHLAGGLGAALLQRFLAQDWLRRQHGSRAVTVTARGRREFERVFRLRV